MNLLEIVLACALDLSTVFYYLTYVYWADKYGAWLYSKGLTTRLQSSINYATAGRNYKAMMLEEFFVMFITFFPAAWVLVHHVLPVYESLDFSFKLFETWGSLLGIYFCFDTWYFVFHKLFHEIPWLYKTVHKRHHDMLPIDSYVTARAEIFENLILSTPGIVIWALVYLHSAQVPNAWAILVPITSLTSDFVLVHIGYYDTIYMYAINPISLVVQYSFFSSGNIPRHELHHNLFTKNYSPMLPWLDRIFGSVAEPAQEKWKFSYATEKKSK
eukprot:Phypoly_transcript_12800.p1 GENE.Phypoly_transcript_12800~~Phypoly_transcript_12800.p1  ORF type:complete len:293 (+),score=28.92 Phypoly_transcript_12800:66-881(+)